MVAHFPRLPVANTNMRLIIAPNMFQFAFGLASETVYLTLIVEIKTNLAMFPWLLCFYEGTSTEQYSSFGPGLYRPDT